MLRYAPANPLQARIQSVGGTVDMWIAPAITGFLGLALLMAAWLVRSFLEPELREDELA